MRRPELKLPLHFARDLKATILLEPGSSAVQPGLRSRCRKLALLHQGERGLRRQQWFRGNKQRVSRVLDSRDKRQRRAEMKRLLLVAAGLAVMAGIARKILVPVRVQ